MSDVTALVPSVSIDALLLKRAAIIERLTLAHRSLQEVATLSTAILGDAQFVASRFSALRLEDRRLNVRFTDPEDLPRFIRDVDAQLWDYLLSQTGLWTFMNTESRKRWTEHIGKGDIPEMTRENIRATFEKLHAERFNMLEQGVIDLFRSLSWHYKSNLPHKFGKRIVVTYAVHVYRLSVGRVDGSIEHAAANKLDDIIRVFHVLDGKPEPDHRQGAWHVLNDTKWPFHSDRDVDLHGCVSVRGFVNRNMHVRFLREDLVDRCNQIIAKHYPKALPPMERAA